MFGATAANFIIFDADLTNLFFAQMTGIKYHYALNESNELVAIENVSDDDKKKHQYYCLNCGAEMIPRQGKVRIWHFAHKGDDDHCYAETYLHKLAKRLIREKFETSDSFNIAYYRDTKCSFINCPFKNEDECHTKLLKTYNLKDWYDTCQEEIAIDEYIADILLTNSQRPELAPVLIEIQVSHKSTQKKISSGFRIIEIRIETEEDIRKLLENTIEENPDSLYDDIRDYKTIGYAKFFGFNKKGILPEPLELRNIPKYYLFNSGKSFVTNMDEFISCRDAWKKTNEKAIFEASIDCFYLDEPSPYDYGLFAAIQNLKTPLKYCNFCQYHCNGYEFGDKPNFCRLYKKCGTPKNPESSYAQICNCYRENKELLLQLKNTMPPIVIVGITPQPDDVQPTK